MNGEPFRKIEMIGIMACFVGVVMIAIVPGNPDDKYDDSQIG